MAAAAATPSTALDDTPIDLTCPVCYEPFRLSSEGENDLFTPKLLPCGHSFCLRCVKQLHTRMNHNIACPKDRKTFVVDDISTLPTNERILEALREEKSEEQSAAKRSRRGGGGEEGGNGGREEAPMCKDHNKVGE